MFSHHSDEMFQRSKVSKIALWRCFVNVLVIFIVIFFVFVFVVVFLLVRSCFLMTPIRFARLGVWSGRLWIQHNDINVSKWVSDQGRPRAARVAKNSHFACCQKRLCNCCCRFFVVIFLIRHEEVFISSKWEKSCLERRLNCSSEFWPAALKVRRTSSVAIIRWTNDCI